MATKTIKVQAAKQDKKVVLFERHPDHPGGEIFIHGNDTVHEVAHTAAVKKAIHEGTLVEAGKAADDKAKDADKK
jgi:hypothetical protein